MAILAVLALVPSVSFIACIAGILCGILYGLWMHGRQSESGMKQHACLALVLYAASLFAYGAAVDTVAPLDRPLDEAHNQCLPSYTAQCLCRISAGAFSSAV